MALTIQLGPTIRIKVDVGLRNDETAIPASVVVHRAHVTHELVKGMFRVGLGEIKLSFGATNHAKHMKPPFRCRISNCIFRKSSLCPTIRKPNFVYRLIAAWLSLETSSETVSTCSARARSRQAASSRAATPRPENSASTLVFVMKQERSRAS